MTADAPRPHDPMIGTLLAKEYRVVEQIGEGGMGVVYVIEHEGLRKRFAAKVLSAQLSSNAEALARFSAEALAASKLEHENIITITDLGMTADGRPFIVMELLRGQTLEQRMAQGPMTVDEILQTMVPTCEALAFAHDAGIVHRDVKPENVFLAQRPSGRVAVKLLDFGIAKVSLGDSRITKLGTAFGTPIYMSPEACRGEDVDRPADIYAIGVLLYRLFCGRAPFFDGNPLKVMQQHVNEAVPSPRALQPSLSPGLERMLLHALEKDPARRPATMRALLAELLDAVPPEARASVVGTGGLSSPTPQHPGLATPSPAPRPAVVSTDPTPGPARPSSGGIGAPRSYQRAATPAPVGAGSSRGDGRGPGQFGPKSAAAEPSRVEQLQRRAKLRRRWVLALVVVTGLAAIGGAVLLRSRAPAPTAISEPPAPAPTP
ncbi:MAG: protein kinase [Kofleriaceae bacterium]